jgi:hypothetical protein
VIRIPSDPTLEWSLVKRAGDQLKAHRQGEKDYAHLVERKLAAPVSLNKTDQLKFIILHRQFNGRSVLGLTAAVSAGRFLVKTWKKIRGNA